MQETVDPEDIELETDPDNEHENKELSEVRLLSISTEEGAWEEGDRRGPHLAVLKLSENLVLEWFEVDLDSEEEDEESHWEEDLEPERIVWDETIDNGEKDLS